MTTQHRHEWWGGSRGQYSPPQCLRCGRERDESPATDAPDVREAIAKALCSPNIRSRWKSYTDTDHAWTHRNKADLILETLDALGWALVGKRELLELRGWPDMEAPNE